MGVSSRRPPPGDVEECPWCGAMLLVPVAGTRAGKGVLHCPECGGRLPPRCCEDP
ncbi:hypothetical protein [Caldinitratiruptor microaerophilus]|uniref:Transcription factor zinc-finger domain-containing protein n=1 Tax=Caldinitratiruptor microaerophilus TaxID=671077 RepID=A0AA35G7W0_9FIRM|nr:hypothetical protein [Caldinitratiruptor microaerophilus]BDG60471.1 hypothetical protein caldi_15610 [Caldinitratiruptor microaerophilus]